MAHSVTVTSMVARVRDEADIESGDQSASIVTDAQIITLLDRAYRELYDLICEEAPLEHFGATATLSSPWSLSATTYRVVAVDGTVDGETVALLPFNLGERNAFADGARPRWTELAGVLSWRPDEPSGSVTVWYVPTPTAVAAGNSVDVFNGWDDFLVTWAVIRVRDKQEYDTIRKERELARIERRIRNNAIRKRGASGRTIADTRSEPDRAYYNA